MDTEYFKYIFKKLLYHYKNESVSIVDNVNEQRNMIIELTKKLTLNEDLYFYNSDLFTFILIAKYIHLIKRKLKPLYSELPWEEVEFNLAYSINMILKMHNHLDLMEWYHFKRSLENIVWQSSECKSKLRKIVAAYDLEIEELQRFSIPYLFNSMMREELIEHLQEFSEFLEIRQFTKEDISSDLPDKSHDKIMGFSKSLYYTYESAKDSYSLERILLYIELALSINPNEKLGKYVIKRTLQVMGEYLKYTHESPHLSNISRKSLINNGISEEIINSLLDTRNVLSHSNYLSAITKFENEYTNNSIFSGIQKQLKHTKDVIEKVNYEVVIRRSSDKINCGDICDDIEYEVLKNKVTEFQNKLKSSDIESIENSAFEILSTIRNLRKEGIIVIKNIKKIEELITGIFLNIKFGKIRRYQNKLFGLINEASNDIQRNTNENINMIEKLNSKILEYNETITTQNAENFFLFFHKFLEKEIVVQQKNLETKLRRGSEILSELKSKITTFFNENTMQSEEGLNNLLQEFIRLKILDKDKKNEISLYCLSSNWEKVGDYVWNLFSTVRIFEATLKSANIQTPYYNRLLMDIFNKYYNELSVSNIMEEYSKTKSSNHKILADFRSKMQTNDVIFKLEKFMTEQKKIITKINEITKDVSLFLDCKNIIIRYNKVDKFDKDNEELFKNNFVQTILGNNIRYNSLISSYKNYINNGKSTIFNKFIEELQITQSDAEKINTKFSELYSESVKKSELINILGNNLSIIDKEKYAELINELDTIELMEKILNILKPFANIDQKKKNKPIKEDEPIKDDDIKLAIENLDQIINDDMFKELNDLKILVNNLSKNKEKITKILNSYNKDVQKKISKIRQKIKYYLEFIKTEYKDSPENYRMDYLAKIRCLIDSLTNIIDDEQKTLLIEKISSVFKKFGNNKKKIDEVLQNCEVSDDTKFKIQNLDKIVELLLNLINSIKEFLVLKNIDISGITKNIKVLIKDLIASIENNLEYSKWNKYMNNLKEKFPGHYKEFIKANEKFIKFSNIENFGMIVSSLRNEDQCLLPNEREILNNIFLNKLRNLYFVNLVQTFKEKLTEKFTNRLKIYFDMHMKIYKIMPLMTVFSEKNYYHCCVSKLEKLQVLEEFDKEKLNYYFDSNRKEGRQFLKMLGLKILSDNYIKFILAYNSLKKTCNEENINNLKIAINELNLDSKDEESLHNCFNNLSFVNLIEYFDKDNTHEIYNQLRERQNVYDGISELMNFFSEKLRSEHDQVKNYENYIKLLCSLSQLEDKISVEKSLRQLLNYNSFTEKKKGKNLVLKLKMNLPDDYKKFIKAYEEFKNNRNNENFMKFSQTLNLPNCEQKELNEKLDKAFSDTYRCLNDFKNIFQSINEAKKSELTKKKLIYDIIFTELIHLFDKTLDVEKEYTEQKFINDLKNLIKIIYPFENKDDLVRLHDWENWKYKKFIVAYENLFNSIKLGKKFTDISQHFNNFISNFNIMLMEDKKLQDDYIKLHDEDMKLLNNTFFKALAKQKYQYTEDNFKRKLGELNYILPKIQNIFDKKTQAAIEVTLCEILDIFVTVEPELERTIVPDSSFLGRISFRNYLAHGDILVDISFELESGLKSPNKLIYDYLEDFIKKEKEIIALKTLVEDMKMKEYLIASDGKCIDNLESEIPNELMNLEDHIRLLQKNGKIDWIFILKNISNTLKNTSNELKKMGGLIEKSVKIQTLVDLINCLGMNKINDFKEKLNIHFVKEHESLFKNIIEISHYWTSHLKNILENRSFSIKNYIELPNRSENVLDIFCDNLYIGIIKLELLDSLHYSNSNKAENCLNILDTNVNEIQIGHLYPIIHFAAKYSNFDTIEYLIGKGARFKDKNHNGETPLHYAAIFKSKEDFIKILELFKHETNTDCVNTLKDNNGWTLLHHAVKANNLEVIKYLIELGANIYDKDNNGTLPLHIAAMFGHKEIVGFLINEKKIEINITDKFGYTLLHHASGGANFYKDGVLWCEHDRLWVDENKRLDVIKFLIDTKKELILTKTCRDKDDKCDNGDLTALHLATIDGNKNIAKLLIEKGKKLLKKDVVNIYGQLLTPLHYAALNGCVNVVEILIKNGAKINALSLDSSKTALHLATESGHKKTIEKLLIKGANPNTSDIEGLTPLLYAVQKEFQNNHNDITIIKILLGYGSVYNSTLLAFASGGGNFKIVKYLWDEVLSCKRSTINAKDINGFTALHNASEGGYLKVLTFLCYHGADINIRSNDNTVPLHLAAQNSHKEVICFLLKKGANKNVRNNEDRTPRELVENELKKLFD